MTRSIPNLAADKIDRPAIEQFEDVHWVAVRDGLWADAVRRLGCTPVQLIRRMPRCIADLSAPCLDFSAVAAPTPACVGVPDRMV